MSINITRNVSLADLVRDVYAVFGWRVPALCFLMGLVALFEGASMATLLPLLSAVGLGDVGAQQGITARLFDRLDMPGSIGGSFAVVVVVLVAQGIGQINQTWWIAKLQRSYGAHWQRKLTRAFFAARWSFFTDHKQGELTNALAYETIRLAGAFQVSAQIVATIVVGLVYFILALMLSWQLTLILIAFAGLLFIVLQGISRRNYRIGLSLGPLSSELAVLLSEYVGGAKLIKATATEPIAERRLIRVFENLRVAHTWATFLPGLTRTLFEFLSLLVLCCLLVAGHLWLATPAAVMLLVLALFVRLLPRINALLQNLQLVATYLPAMSGLRSLYEAARADVEVNPIVSQEVNWPESSIELNVDIQEACYGNVVALQDVHLSLPSKGFIGIVGPSGSGKSTLVHCLLGLNEIRHGSICAGKVDMREMPTAKWRAGVGLVPQDTLLFHLSIAENIAWGDEAPDMHAVEHAARRAHAHEFILDQPKGYETSVGDRGVRLSGGQRQRLGIARALYRNPHFLLLDEATSALDSASESVVLSTIEKLRHEICVVSIAHRLAAVRTADLIVVLESGRIVQTGSWQDLYTSPGLLRDLANAQQLT